MYRGGVVFPGLFQKKPWDERRLVGNWSAFLKPAVDLNNLGVERRTSVELEVL
jgi:hypothetical protein